MCLAIPMQLKSRDGDEGVVENGGLSYKVSLRLLPEVAIGDYVLVHAGFAIQKLDLVEAEATINLLNELGQAGSEDSN